MQLADEIVSRIRGKVDQYSVLEAQEEQIIVRFYNGRASISVHGVSTSAQAYISRGRRQSVAIFSRPSAVQQDADAALASLDSMPEGDVLELPERSSYSSNMDYDRELDEQAIAEKVQEAMSGASSGGARVAGIIKAGIARIRIETSTGNSGEDVRSYYNLYLRAFRGGMSGSGVEASTRISRLNARRAGEDASERLRPIDSAPVQDGTYDVILGPITSAALFELMGYMASARAIETGMSFFGDYMGKPVAPDGISIVDRGQVEDGINSRSFDDEGAPTGVVKIVENGMARGVLHNTLTAKRWKARTTGNAGLIEPSPWNITVEGGDSGLEEMLREARNAIFITGNWYTRFNSYRTGEFSTIVRDSAYLVNGGDMKLVRGIRLSDRLPRLLSNIALASKERRWIRWWGEVVTPVLAPYIYVRGATITVA